MSIHAQYSDTVEALSAKRAFLVENRAAHVGEILNHFHDQRKMAEVLQWEGRAPMQWLRREIIRLAHCARGWASHGTTPLGGKPSEHDLAMRETLVEELRTWLQARRQIITPVF